jgi:hypothetical protein
MFVQNIRGRATDVPEAVRGRLEDWGSPVTAVTFIDLDEPWTISA